MSLFSGSGKEPAERMDLNLWTGRTISGCGEMGRAAAGRQKASELFPVTGGKEEEMLLREA